MTRTSKTQSGVTLIELLIGLVVLSLLLGLGVPAFRTWIQNTQIRTAADALLNGLQVARAEAIRHNRLVQFQLGNQTEWSVSTVAVPPEQLQYRPNTEGTTSTAVTVTPGGATTVTFNSMGGTVANNDTSQTITAIDIRSSNLSSARTLRIVVSPSGAARMCDPPTNVPALPAGDPRAC